jgi:hypothetical protein
MLEHLGKTSHCPITVYKPTQILYHLHGGGEVSWTDDLLWCGRLGSLMGRALVRETRPVRSHPVLGRS